MHITVYIQLMIRLYGDRDLLVEPQNIISDSIYDDIPHQMKILNTYGCPNSNVLFLTWLSQF